jgi:hypothetical protein
MLGDAVAEEEDFLVVGLREGLSDEAGEEEEDEACHDGVW